VTRRILCLFLKYPRRGYVKRRLSRVIGSGRAFLLYKQSLFRTLQEVRVSRVPFAIYASGKLWPESSDLRFPGSGHIRIQKGRDLGQRILDAVLRERRGGRHRIIVIGSDCPSLKAKDIVGALRELERTDAVIGPALDGGYYLLGFRFPNKIREDRFLSNGVIAGFFRQITWGRGTVYRETLARMKRAGLRVRILRPRMDLDRIQDVCDETMDALFPLRV